MEQQIVIDLKKWTPLRGDYLPFMQVECEAPDPEPADGLAWQEWIGIFLAGVAQSEQWQAGRYAYVAEQRDEDGHGLEQLTRGMWEWIPIETRS